MKYELSIEAAAKLLGVGESRVSQLVACGTLESTTIRGNRRISRESVESYRMRRRGRGRTPVSEKPATRRFTLMSADYEVMDLLYDPTSEQPFICEKVLDADRAPFSVLTSGGACKRRELNEWWAHRSIPATRPGMEAKLLELGIGGPCGVALKNIGLSLSDCYWLRPDGRPDLDWRSVNYYENDFAFSADGAGDGWLAQVGLDSPDNTSEGELPKRWVIRKGIRMLLKGSRGDSQRPFNEVAATALHERLLSAGDFVPYELADTADGPACMCANFLNGREEYVPAAYIKAILGATRGSSTYDRLCRFSGKLGMDERAVRRSMGQMIVCDHILANNDRHWRNFGFIRNVDTLEMRPAPLFDSGNCLWFAKTDEEVGRGDRSFSSRPFSAIPEEQLSYVEYLDWFDGSALDGFCEQALAILSGCASVCEGGRLAYIEEGLRDRVASTASALAVLRYR